MLIRGKNLIEPIPLFEIFFSLIKCQDKELRKTLFTHMLNDVKKIKTKLKNYKLCSVIFKKEIMFFKALVIFRNSFFSKYNNLYLL